MYSGQWEPAFVQCCSLNGSLPQWYYLPAQHSKLYELKYSRAVLAVVVGINMKILTIFRENFGTIFADSTLNQLPGIPPIGKKQSQNWTESISQQTLNWIKFHHHHNQSHHQVSGAWHGRRQHDHPHHRRPGEAWHRWLPQQSAFKVFIENTLKEILHAS